ncbi:MULTISPECIES: hypothetical protein [Halostella]|nr:MULTISPECIES: hypothetical protein [Halostella]
MEANNDPPANQEEDRYCAYETEDDRFVVYDADNDEAWIHSSETVAVER